MERVPFGTRCLAVKKFLKVLIIILAVLVLIVGGYFIYVFASYHRIPDREYLDTGITSSYSSFRDETAVNTEDYYNFLTYNIGFGAYTDDYDFFMDGGKQAWAKSEEALLANLCEISDVINYSGADFVLLQEVDIDGTRTYHVNELDVLNQFLKGFYYTSAVCYDSPFLFWPLYQPHGKNKTVMATYSRNPITESVRRSFPIPEDFSKLIDLDRCYIVSRVPVANERTLVIYNVHMSAYTGDSGIKDAQLKMLFDDMKSEYAKGNYVVCGGDFNMNMKDDLTDPNLTWTRPFDRSLLPEGFSLGLDYATDEAKEHNSCRNPDKAYDPETAYTVTPDAFIVSDNIRVQYYRNLDCGYKYSDHDPVMLQVFFKSDAEIEAQNAKN